MKRYQIPLEEGKYYHIYNRGNNRDRMFFNDYNYVFFMGRCRQYLSKSCDILAYCLLPNHFHMLVYVKEQPVKSGAIASEALLPAVAAPAPAPEAKLLTAEQGFHRLFTSYSKAINKEQKRHGSLIENPFKRIEIDSDEYLRNVVVYIHTNPELHGFCDDFSLYRWSSYNSILNNTHQFAVSENILSWFEDSDNYRFCHFNRVQAFPDEDLYLE
ncbi:hypothetical protein DSECCO2_587480 [anaerobic digester metagenome]